MSRLPFNPDRTRAARDAPLLPEPESASGDQPLTVSELAGRIKGVLSDHLPRPVRVVGEVSNLSNRQHWFFSIKDAGATLRCVCFASSARRLRVPIEDGMQIVATGRVDFYDQQGHVQLYVDSIEPVGQGTLELRLRQLMAELRELGYFDESHKKPMPAFPQRVAVVTSRSAAALQDVINTAHRRWPGCQLLLYDVRVQGEAAAPEIARAIRTLSQHGSKLGIDAIVLTRGGGSIEDLWAFNERAVADALFECALPIVAAIGHETDTTLAELVADLRCATPTQAVMKLIPDQAALAQQVDYFAGRLRQEMTRQLREGKHRLSSCAKRGLFLRPGELVERARKQLAQCEAAFTRALPMRLEHAAERLTQREARLLAAGPRLAREPRQRLDALAKHLEAVSPKRVLSRGYTYTLGPDGKLLREAAQVRPGETITTVLADGRLRSRVEGQGTTGDETTSPPSRPTKRRGKSKPSGPASEQGGLFG